jgi:eukaryotic-like serine/threonine-protein kinase
VTVIELPTPDPRTLDDAVRPFAEAIAERYAIKRLIGTGGMGMVYLARDKRLDRVVAIKTLPAHLAHDPLIRERFLRETRTAGAMAHPNIVAMHGADEIAGHVFFVMSYIRGASLATRVRAHGRLDAASVLSYLHDVASALAHAHDRGIIHRDIKSENILIDQDSDRALVTDFGIARLAEASPLTVTGQVLGSVHYVSPEQVSGDPVDARTDIYSLGVVGFLALTGRFPFDAELASAVMLQHVTRAAAPIASVQPDVPPAIAAIIDRCLSKSPAHRFASAAQLADALDAARSAPIARTPRITDAEAQQVWQRAAELQAATGLQPRPAIVPRARDLERDASRSSGLLLGDVRSAALEAGIGADYVDHALGEHGLMSPNSALPVAASPAHPTGRDTNALTIAPMQRSWWARVPMRSVVELTVAGEVDVRAFDGVVNVLRDATGSLGMTVARTRELAWQAGSLGSRMEVSVVPEAGQTHVRIVRDLRRSLYARAALTAAVTLGVVMPTVIVVLAEGFRWREEAAVLSALGTAGLFVWQVGRRFLRRGHAALERKTRSIAERVGDHVRGRLSRRD